DFTYKKSAMAKPWRFFVLRRILSLQQNAQHAAQRFGCTPEQLITDGERTQIMRAHVELAQPPYRHAQSTGHSSRTQLLHARVTMVGNQFHPGVVLTDHALDIRDRHILVQFDGQRLAVAAHGANAHADTIDRNRVLEASEDLVGLSLRLPLFAALPIRQFLVDIRNQAAGQRHTEVIHGESFRTLAFGNLAIDFQNSAGWIGQLVGHRRVDAAHLPDQLTHVLRTSTRRRLIGHGAHPLDQTVLEQAAQPHQHQTDSAVSADIIKRAGVELLVDHATIHRIKHDYRIVLHAQGRSSIDPVTFPAGFTQLWEDLIGVVATLTGQNHIKAFQLIDVVGVLQRRNVLANGGPLATNIGGGEEHGLDQVEVPLFQHPLHEHGTDHTAPTDQTYTFHRNYTYIN